MFSPTFIKRDFNRISEKDDFTLRVKDRIGKYQGYFEIFSEDNILIGWEVVYLNE